MLKTTLEEASQYYGQNLWPAELMALANDARQLQLEWLLHEHLEASYARVIRKRHTSALTKKLRALYDSSANVGRLQGKKFLTLTLTLTRIGFKARSLPLSPTRPRPRFETSRKLSTNASPGAAPSPANASSGQQMVPRGSLGVSPGTHLLACFGPCSRRKLIWKLLRGVQ